MADKVDFGPRIGADPELFIATYDENNPKPPIIPACGLIGGTKEEPTDITQMVFGNFGRPHRQRDAGKEPKGIYAVQEDNVMLEFNIPGFTTYEDFVRGISAVLTTIEQNILAPKKLVPRYGVVSYEFPKSVLEVHPQALQIGCLPDLNAYAMDGNFERSPFSALDFGLHRFCGGHLHVQYNHNNVPHHIMAQFMDLVACLPFLAWDKQKERRQFYGQPGLFRRKDYGIEYRTLSNFWLKPEFRASRLYAMAENVLELAKAAQAREKMLQAVHGRIPWAEVQRIIKEEDTKAAAELVLHIRQTTELYINIGRD